MFDSTPWYGDLMFTDDAVRLIRIPESKQTYKDYLGADFVGQVENLHQYTCVPVDSANSIKLSFIYLIAVYIIMKILCWENPRQNRNMKNCGKLQHLSKWKHGKILKSSNTHQMENLEIFKNWHVTMIIICWNGEMRKSSKNGVVIKKMVQ